MRSFVVVLGSILLLALVVPSAAATAYGPIGYGTGPLIEPVFALAAPLDPVCADLLSQGRADGTLGNESAGDAHYGYEWDPFAQQPACADLRDQLQYEVGVDPENVEVCQAAYGQNCVGLAHEVCDFYLIVGSGLVYPCWGGLTPYN